MYFDEDQKEREVLRNFLSRKVHGYGVVREIKYIGTLYGEMIFSVLLKNISIEGKILSHLWALYIKDFKKANFFLFDRIEFDCTVEEYNNNNKEKLGIFNVRNVNVIEKANNKIENFRCPEIECIGLYDDNRKLKYNEDFLKLKEKFLIKYKSDFQKNIFNLKIDSKKYAHTLTLNFKPIILNNCQLNFKFYPDFKNCLILNDKFLIRITNESYVKLLNLFFFDKYQKIKDFKAGFFNNKPFPVEYIKLLCPKCIDEEGNLLLNISESFYNGKIEKCFSISNKNIHKFYNNIIKNNKGEKNMKFTKELNYEEIKEIIKELNPVYEDGSIKIDENTTFNSNILKKDFIENYEGLYEEIFKECEENYKSKIKKEEYEQNYEILKAYILSQNPICINVVKSRNYNYDEVEKGKEYVYNYDFIKLNDNKKFGDNLMADDVKDFDGLFKEIEQIALKNAINKLNAKEYQEKINQYINFHNKLKSKASDADIDINLFIMERILERLEDRL